MSNDNGTNKAPDALHETAARGVEAIHAIVQQRDELLVKCDRQQIDLGLFRERCRQLEQRLATASVERDHYMRYCTELTARLNNIQVLIASTIEEAKRAAYRPTQTVAAKQMEDTITDEDAAELADLLQRLPQNSGDTRQ